MQRAQSLSGPPAIRAWPVVRPRTAVLEEQDEPVSRLRPVAACPRHRRLQVSNADQPYDVRGRGAREPVQRAMASKGVRALSRVCSFSTWTAGRGYDSDRRQVGFSRRSCWALDEAGGGGRTRDDRRARGPATCHRLRGLADGGPIGTPARQVAALGEWGSRPRSVNDTSGLTVQPPTCRAGLSAARAAEEAVGRVGALMAGGLRVADTFSIQRPYLSRMKNTGLLTHLCITAERVGVRAARVAETMGSSSGGIPRA